MSSPYHTLKVTIYCLMVMCVDVGKWHLVQFIHKSLHVHHIYNWNFEGCSIAELIGIGHTHRLEETWLLVLGGDQHCSLPLVLHSNLNPNGFLYPNSLNPPIQPWCSLYQCFPLMPIAHILQLAFFHFQDAKRKWDLPIHLLLLSFLISHVHHIW